ncbi:MAG: cyclic nucleotide-binding domain-containing protein, partial [Hyphomicrobiaceae bacterium]|nr:cyclic nucleotide-binding domain-containing protein [Hyphomicrobiaceae bacterium]
MRTAKTASKTSGATEAPPLDAAEAGRDVRTLSAGDFLFQEGDPRTHAFRIESGGICVYKTLPDGGRDVLEFAFSGDLVGLGYHGNHVATAQATTQTSVSCLPSTAQEPVTKKSRPAKAGVSTALKREAALIHEAVVSACKTRPIERVAALFVTLSHFNSYEGRVPDIITDSLKCGVVAGYLNMSLDLLT